jgi:hypothetical protein
MKEDFYWVYVTKQVPSVQPHMHAWCEQECEGLYTHHNVSWQREGWYFTHESDAILFRLTWSEYISTQDVS